MHESKLRLLVLGAHPDDAEFHSGGLAAAYRQHGHHVQLVSATDGSAGHHRRPPGELAELRRTEAARAAEVIGAESDVWTHADGWLLPTLDLRRQIISQVRRYRPDVLVTHRTCDYHPDHRALAQAVQDACYMFRVPHVVPELPALDVDPVVLFMPDDFTRPAPLEPHLALDVAPQLDRILAMLAAHRSQVFEWLPHVEGWQLPDDEPGRQEMLRRWYTQWLRRRTDRYRARLAEFYGPRRAAEVEVAEWYEISEYGRTVDERLRQRLFGFLWT